MRTAWAANGSLLATAVAWGTTAPVFHELLKTWDPVTLTAVRFTLTAPLFYIWLRLGERTRLRPSSRRAWRETWILGFLLVAFAVALNVGIRLTDPITAAVFSAGTPLVSTVIDWILNGRRPPPRVVFAIPLAIGGGVLASVDIGGLGNARFNAAGSLWLLMAIVLWPLYSTLLQRWLVGFSQLRRTAASFAASVPYAAAASVIFVAAGLEALPAALPGPKGLLLIGWTVVGTSIVGTFCWNVGVSKIGISIASMFLNFIPVVAIVVSMAFGIVPTLGQIGGGLLVMLGVAVAQGWHRQFRFAAGQ